MVLNQKLIDNNHCISLVFDIFDDKALCLIWERNAPKPMTLAEIEKELGYPITIVD